MDNEDPLLEALWMPKLAIPKATISSFAGLLGDAEEAAAQSSVRQSVPTSRSLTDVEFVETEGELVVIIANVVETTTQ